MDIGPISLFDCVKSNQPSDCANLDFDEFVSLMEQYAADEFASKNDATLICLTEFAGGEEAKPMPRDQVWSSWILMTT